MVSKVKHRNYLCPSNSTPSCILKRNKSVHLHSSLYMNVHSSLIQNGQKMQAAQMSIVWCMDDQVHTVEYYVAIQVSELLICTTTWMNLENMMLKWKKPDIEGCVLYDSICVKGPEKADLQRVGRRLPRVGEGGETGWGPLMAQGLFLGWWKYSTPDCGDGWTTPWIYWKPWKCTL